MKNIGIIGGLLTSVTPRSGRAAAMNPEEIARSAVAAPRSSAMRRC